MQQNTLACRTMTDLRSCLASKSHCVPTVEFNVLNLEAPLSLETRALLELPELNLFVANQQTARSGQIPATSTSKNLSEPTITFDTPFIMMGLCVYAYADPYSLVVQGNHFDDQGDFTAAAHLPASPMNLRRTLVPTLFGGAAITPAVSPAQIEWGGPVWRALWAFMHAYRLEMTCPSSSYDILMDESLADIGNCCSQAEWQGFGNSGASHIRITRAMNQRLIDATMPAASGFPGANNGQFVPWNSEQFANGEIVPEVYTADEAAYGRNLFNAAVEQWYELPVPIPFPSIPQPKLKITLRKQDGDQGYVNRMIDEVTANYDLNPVAVGGVATSFPLNDPPIVGDAEGYGGMTRLPGGLFRIGVGIKGFLVRANVCDDLACLLAGKPIAEMQNDPRLVPFLGRGGVVTGPYQGPAVACGPMGVGNGR